MWTADIDVGGTLTDGVFTNGDGVVCVKVDTTPHDLTVCLFDCLTQAADKVGFAGVAEFLDHIELIRWSTTITSNVLAELSGPRVGLLVSHGHEKDLYGREPSGVVLNRILAEKDVIGLGRNADETDIMNAARTLLESGVRRICVSLAGSHRHPEREISVKRTIDQQYPDHFLGSVPVLAGSDISQVADDQTRTHCALINAYTHSALASTLFKAEDELREKARYSGAFLVSHINGGVAGIAKTRAIDTIESGPILGIHASAFMAQAYGLRDVIAMDVGGTTAKIGVLKNGAPVNRKPSDFFGIPVDIPLPDLHSIPLGGGSVIRLRANGHHPAIQLGPESMGSYPGPACYDLGGDRPTLTDAFVAAGLINPDYFLGGTKPLNRDLATQAIEESIGKPLGVSTMDACGTVIGRAFEMVANVISNARAGHDFAADALLAYGGNGGLFACGVAEKAGLNRVHVFSLGPVFSAFGSSVSDISHVYERSLPGLSITDTAAGRIRQVVEEMKAESTKYLLGEGVQPEEAVFEIELDVSANELSSFSVPCPESAISGGTELHEWLSSACGLSVEPGNTAAELVRLKAKKSVTKPALVERPLQEPDSSKAHIGPREVFWGSGAGEAQIYKWESLRPGNRVIGSALVEGANTTYFIPQGWVMNVDAFGNGTLHRK